MKNLLDIFSCVSVYTHEKESSGDGPTIRGDLPSGRKLQALLKRKKGGLGDLT